MKFLKVTVWITALVAATAVMAAVNPESPGIKSSEGSFRITYFNGTQILIYGLEDIELSSADATESPTSANLKGKDFTPFCVAETPETGHYEISISSPTNFKLTSSSVGATNIPYILTVQSSENGHITEVGQWGWGDDTHKSGTFAQNEALTADSGIKPPYTCNSSLSQGRTISVELVDPDLVSAGAYADEVTVTVAPI